MAIVISCENANITSARPKHSTTRSLHTCHHCGMMGHIRPNGGQLNSARTWNKKNAPKKDQDVEKDSKSKYFPPHKRKPTQRFAPTCHLSVCNWLHSVGQNHFYVMMLLNRDSAIQSASRRFCTIYKSEKSNPLQLSGRRDIPSGRPTVQSIVHPDDENFPSGPSSVSRSFKLL